MESATAVESFKGTGRDIYQILSALDKLTSDAEQRKMEFERGFEELRNSVKVVHDAHAKTEEIVGNLGGRFGVLVEQLLIPGIRPLMNTYGHDFTTIVPSITLHKKKLHTQIDMMLYNSTEAMAVEIKAKLDQNDVALHIERLKKLRALENSIFIKGLTLLGAVAAIVIDDRAKKFALDNGLYVIKIREDKDKLTADKPKSGKVGKW